MCGILGIMERNGNVDVSVLNNMQKALYHRGPDDKGLEITEIIKDGKRLSCGIGFVRLSIRDLSINGHQPMLSDDGQVILTMNGEIYNSEELRPQLIDKGISFKSTTDTEVLLKMYLEFGLDKTIQQLDGMFAICIVDKRINTAYLIRDRIGEKPLYYWDNGSTLLYASEYKAFYAHPSFKAELNESALTEISMFRYVSGQETILKGVYNLKPGSYLTIAPASIRETQYWSLPLYKSKGKSFEENKEKLYDLLGKSVKRRLISDRPVGLQLSGGIDSSYLCSLVKNVCNKTLTTYSITFKNKSFNEEPYIDHVTNTLDLPSKKTVFAAEELLKYWRLATYHFESPMNLAGSLGLLMINEGASEDVAVMLSGDGPDECTGGYRRHHEIEKIIKEKEKSILRPFWRYCQLKGLVKHNKIFTNIDDYYISKSQWVEGRFAKKLISGGYRKKSKTVYAKRREQVNVKKENGLHKYLCYDITGYMQDILMRTDKMSMAVSLEVRVPYLMPELLEFYQTLPDEQCVDVSKSINHGTKMLLKSLARDVFGENFTYRTKMGTTNPLLDYFMDSSVRQYVESELLPSIKNRKLYNYKYIHKLWDKTQNNTGKVEWGELEALWTMFSFEIWAKMFIDGNPIEQSIKN